jgi:hypothetical protein
MKKGIYTFILIASVFLFMANPANAAGFGNPTSAVIYMHIAGSLTINGNAAAVGDEVALFDQAGNIVGVFVVNNEGIYGDMNISGDDATSSEDKGADEGETLIIKVLQASTNTVYTGENVIISTPPEGNTVYIPYTESVLKFEGGSFYLLNIEAI